MTYIHPIAAEVDKTAADLGGKAFGLIVLRRLGLPVPAGFVISTAVCRAFLRDGHFPTGFRAELTTALAALEAATQRSFGGAGQPLIVSVRSGASMSMPGMMSTVVNLGFTTTPAHATDDPHFETAARSRFRAGFSSAIRAAVDTNSVAAQYIRRHLDKGPEDFEYPAAGTSTAEQRDLFRQLELAIAAVCASWESPRARTFRAIHDIPGDIGTAVTVQAMVFGNRDRRSGSGVAFSRDPNTGEHRPFGDLVFGGQGDDIVAGGSATLPLGELAEREPAVWDHLMAALNRIEAHHRDSCSVEFTFESGELWLLQVHHGNTSPAAAVRIAVDLADEGVIERREALLRITPRHLRYARTPRLILGSGADVLARGRPACPGVAVGRAATTSEAAVRMAAAGPVVLVRPETSPLDMAGLAAAAGVLTTYGGPACHAAVVARAMGKPAVVGLGDLIVGAATIRIGERVIAEGTPIALDGTSGEVTLGAPRIGITAGGAHLGRLLDWADEVSGDHTARADDTRLRAARAVLLSRPPNDDTKIEESVRSKV